MFLSEWRQFPSAPCLVGQKKLDDSSRLDVVEIALYRGADKSLAQPGRKQANVSVRMASISFRRLAL